jgi:hypothetical protein
MIEDLQQAYGDFYEQCLAVREMANALPMPILDSSSIPVKLRPLIPYAQIWGFSDDGYRVELIRAAPRQVWTNLRRAVSLVEDELLEWLTSSETRKNNEYFAFSNLLQAYDWPRSD